jgi:two-component system, cell cycle sensor histidine kinase and response regulator CckA
VSVEEMRRMLPTVLGEDIEVAFELEPGLWPVLADPTQISQVIMNLAANARDAMPTGGCLTVRTANVQASGDGDGAGPDVPPGRYALLAVEDTGMGMSEETREHIFEPFFTTKERGAGTGLGLSSVYGIMEQSGGHIRVETAPGRGTAFSMYFPASGAEARDAASPPAATGQKAGAPQASETILLVEDEAGVCELLTADLRDLGYRVLPHRTVGEALQAAEAHQAPIDLLLTDVVLPGMSGPVLARLLKERGRVRQVLFMSGHTERHIAQHGVLEDGIEFIGKPFTSEELAAKIRALLDGQPSQR